MSIVFRGTSQISWTKKFPVPISIGNWECLDFSCRTHYSYGSSEQPLFQKEAVNFYQWTIVLKEKLQTNLQQTLAVVATHIFCRIYKISNLQKIWSMPTCAEWIHIFLVWFLETAIGVQESIRFEDFRVRVNTGILAWSIEVWHDHRT